MRALVFRCDETAETGLGHFARCRDLARLLQQASPDLAVTFAGELSPFSQAVLVELGFSHRAMGKGEALVSEDLLRAVGDGARLLVDSYRLDESALSALATWPASWGVFDDFGSFQYQGAQLVINSRVSARPEMYRAAFVAAGSGYFAATPELYRARVQRATVNTADEPERALVFIGGNDLHGVGPELARAVTRAFRTTQVRLVQAQPLSDVSDRVERIPLGPGLESELASTSLVVAGGGRLKYEACYCQSPCASVSQTIGQAEDTAELAARGLCVDLGSTVDFDAEKVVSALRELWRPNVLTTMRQAQSHWFPAEAPQQLAQLVKRALQLD